MKARVLGILFIAVAGLYGCAATPEAAPAAAPTEAAPAAAEQPVAPTPEATPAPAEGAQTAPAETTGGQFQGSPLQDPSSPLYKKVFYFPFDSSEIAAADRDVLAAHAKFLASNPGVKVVAEGHADERGTREYNLALGERRAQAVQRLLMLQGAAQGQSKVVTYGEERPVAVGHDESAWRLNRRVELLYSGY
jgi:peptidoglycan-associated lipoprotein